MFRVHGEWLETGGYRTAHRGNSHRAASAAGPKAGRATVQHSAPPGASRGSRTTRVLDLRPRQQGDRGGGAAKL